MADIFILTIPSLLILITHSIDDPIDANHFDESSCLVTFGINKCCSFDEQFDKLH